MSRTRTQNLETILVSGTRLVTQNGATISTSYSDHTHYKDQVCEDTLTPKFMAKQRSGDFLPINSCNIATVTTPCVVQTLSGSRPISGQQPYILSGTQVAYKAVPFTMVPWEKEVEQARIDQVVINALSQAKEPEWDILTFLGEFPKTVQLIADRWNKIRRMAERLRDKAHRRELKRIWDLFRELPQRRKRELGSNWKRALYNFKRMWKDFMSLWLEARYGWRPLIYDVQSAVSALRHTAQTGILRKSSTVETSGEFTGTPVVKDYTNVQRYTTTEKRTWEQKYRAVVFYRSTAGPIGANPVITAWEMTRFSFVVDWFINIGSWLQAISPRFGFANLGVSVSCTTKSRQTYETTITGLGSWSISGSVGKSGQHVDRYQRWAYSGIPIPRFNVRLNWPKVVDLVALVTQFASGFGMPPSLRL